LFGAELHTLADALIILRPSFIVQKEFLDPADPEARAMEVCLAVTEEVRHEPRGGAFEPISALRRRFPGRVPSAAYLGLLDAEERVTDYPGATA